MPVLEAIRAEMRKKASTRSPRPVWAPTPKPIGRRAVTKNCLAPGWKAARPCFGTLAAPTMTGIRATGDRQPRLIFACDEVAEAPDKAGLSKEQKDLAAQIESKLPVLARQGRAFGIHLILAAQRPDATILSGQMRNSIDCRICGRADNVLSHIILDSPAADLIPKDARGRFLLHDGTIFQGRLFDEQHLTA